MTSRIEPSRRVVLGRVAGAFGIKGELRIESWTQPRAAILGYQPWWLRRADGYEFSISGVEGVQQGQQIIARFPDVNERAQAQSLYGYEIQVPRDRLPPPQADEYYWVDLEGLNVQTVDGVALGTVSHLFATGANDVLVVCGERERLIPFLHDDVIRRVDFTAKQIVVDWDPDF